MDDDRLRVVFYFGGTWMDDGGRRYIGGKSFEMGVGFDVDRLGFWNIHGFYKVLGIPNVRLWFRRGGVEGDDGLVEIFDDTQIMDMIASQRGYPLTHVFGIEEGDNIIDVEELQRRLNENLRGTNELPNDIDVPEEVWSGNSEDEVVKTMDEIDSEDDPDYSDEDDESESDSDEDSEDDWEEDGGDNEGGNLDHNEGGGSGQNEGGESGHKEGGEDEDIDREVTLDSEDNEPNDDDDYFPDNVGNLEAGENNVVEQTKHSMNDIEELPIVGDSELHDVSHKDDDIIDYPWFSEELMEEGKVVLTNGMKFKSLHQFRTALKEWSLPKGFDFKWNKNNRYAATAVCRRECGFRVHASVIDDAGNFQIKTWSPEHKCSRKWKNKLVNARYIAEKFLEEIRVNPTWPVILMRKSITRRLKCKVTRGQCYRAKRIAQRMINGDIQKQYERLWDYAQVILDTNEGSRVIIMTRDGIPRWEKRVEPGALIHTWIPRPSVPQFLYMYVYFAAQRQGFFSGLRTFVGLDGCFLKGTMGGQLLSAVAKDRNDTMYPLAIAVVDVEDKASWTWFLQNIIKDFGHPNETLMVFMSDKQKGLQEAMNSLLPGVEHRICVKHLYENFKETFKGQKFKELLWNAATTGSKTKFNTYLEEMKKLPMGQKAVIFLKKNDPQTWSRSYFSTYCKTDLVMNNISESFNAAIAVGRDMPILTMLEWIRRKNMKRIYERKTFMDNYNGNLCPSPQKIIERNIKSSSNCFPTAAGSAKFEIECYEGSAVVDLNVKTCTCRMWELTGIPCKHTIAAIHECRLDPEHFVDRCYRRSTYLAVYGHFIAPLPDKDEWPRTNLQDVFPPFIQKPAGRPRKKRIRAADERRPPSKLSRAGCQVKCGNCKQVGHNARGCRAAVTGETPYKRRLRIKAIKKAAQQSGQQSAQSDIVTLATAPCPNTPAAAPNQSTTAAPPKKITRQKKKASCEASTSTVPPLKKNARKKLRTTTAGTQGSGV